MSDEATLASGYGGAYEAGWQSGREDGRKEERARIVKMVESLRDRAYDDWLSEMGYRIGEAEAKGSLDMAVHVLNMLNKKDTTHD